MDGLVTDVSLIAGVAASGAGAHSVAFTGLAGLAAGAFSMASGEYVPVRSQNELTQAEVVVVELQHARNPRGKQRRLRRSS
jgi:VIT1/CCC1 family predicted Fe2+/Mn2+ transporter